VPTPSPAVAHLLRRSGFVPTPADVAALAPLDIKVIVQRLVDGAVGAANPLPTPPIVGDKDADWWERYVAMTWTWLERMRTADPSGALVEKMVLFWHGHFASALEKVGSHPAIWNQNQLFRTKGLGSFRDLAQAVAVDPAMLRYLDNDRNVKGSPNENWARESMELFTLGVNQYSQEDVVGGARAWSGHGLDKEGRYAFRADRHDFGAKTIFGITKAWDGPELLDEIVLGSKKQVSARFIATKLWSFLAYPNPEPAVVDAIVAPYLASNLDIATLLKAIFLRPEFYGPKATGALVRSPIEYVVVAMKGTGLGCDVAHPEWWLEAMGQAPFNPPNVSGWRQNGYWIASSTTWAKAAFAGHLRWKANERNVLGGTQALQPRDAVRTALAMFGVEDPKARTVMAMEEWLRTERRTTRWAERPNLLLLSLLSPDVQLA
jgi:uncharacterized protein (DUF1800 family)